VHASFVTFFYFLWAKINERGVTGPSYSYSWGPLETQPPEGPLYSLLYRLDMTMIELYLLTKFRRTWLHASISAGYTCTYQTTSMITNRQEKIYVLLQPYYNYINHLSCLSSHSSYWLELGTWNSLHVNTRSAETFLTFRSRLTNSTVPGYSYDTWLFSVIASLR